MLTTKRVSRIAVLTAAVLPALGGVGVALAAALPNGIYVERVGGTSAFGVGTGIADSTTALPVFVDSFSFTSGAAPQLTISFPTTSATGARALTDLGHPGGVVGGGTPAAVNIMQKSPDGKYLTIAGYDDPAGAAVRTAGGVKTVGLIDTTTGAVSTQFGFNSSAQPRSIVTTDAVDYWFVGSANGFRHVTPNPSDPNAAVGATQVSINNVNQRTVSIFGGQIFLSGASSLSTGGGNPGVAAFGTGTPKPPESGVTQTYIMSTAANPEQFVMLDLDPGVGYVNGAVNTGLDTGYVATGEGVEKWTFNGSAWAKQYTLSGGLSTDAASKLGGGTVGVAYAGKDASGNPVLYATTLGNNTQTSSAQGNALLTLADTGAAASWGVVTLSPDNTWFRGVQAVGTVPTVVQVPGDADGDGDVDLDDQGIWASNFTGSLDPGTGTGTFGQGDFDGDKDVDLDDQGIWASNFTGSLAPSGLVAAVPEPSTLGLLAAGLVGLVTRRRR